MRDRPKNRIDPESGYPTKSDMAWQSDYAREQLTAFMNRMGKDIFIKYAIEICNDIGRKDFKTEEDLLEFMDECPKAMKNYFDIHGKESEDEKNRARTFVPIVVE